MSVSTSSIEQSLLKSLKKKGVISYVLVDVDKSKFIAVFSTYNDTIEYMIRRAINLCHGMFIEFNEPFSNKFYKVFDKEMFTELINPLSGKAYVNFVKDYIDNYLEIIPVYNLNLQNPVYVHEIKICMKIFSTDPTKYISNNNINNKYLLKINPSLQELEDWIYE